MHIIVGPLSLVPQLVEQRRPSHLITLLDPDHAPNIDTPPPLTPDRHLRIGVNDICDPTDGLLLCQEHMVQELLDFGAGWDEREPILIHCWAGISRSTAAAFTLACERNPEVSERDIAERMRRSSRRASPNRRIVAIADNLLGRGGRMVDAVDSIGRGEPAYENVPFDIPARF
jgi:predicted protein tyrosine phosphatase